MICGDIQSIIRNYESYVIKRRGSTITPCPFRIRPLAQKLTTVSASVRLVRASSLKRQASSPKLFKMKETSVKLQAARFKLQAASIKLLDILPLIKFYLVKGEGLNHNKCILRMITMK